MVIYRGSDGKPGYHQTDDIHDAVGFVEQMRNERGVEHTRIFRLEEVVFQYRPYYHVELADSLGGPVEVGSDDETKPLVSLGEITGGYGSGPSSVRNGNGGSNGSSTSTNGSNGHSEFATVDSINTVTTKSPLNKDGNGSLSNGATGSGSTGSSGSSANGSTDTASSDGDIDSDADLNVALADAKDNGETSSVGSKRSLFGR